MATPLCTLAEQHRVDKCPQLNHSYTPEYDKILSPIRDTARLVVEIGIGTPEIMCPLVGEAYRPGASLRMWRDYFPAAQILGCDIRRDVMFQEDRIQCRLVDQSDRESLKALSFPTAPDLLLDDGSHVPVHMRLTFEVLWPSLKTGGFYIIEDVRLHDIPEFISLQLLFKDCQFICAHKGKGPWDSFVCFQKVPNAR